MNVCVPEREIWSTYEKKNNNNLKKKNDYFWLQRLLYNFTNNNI